MITVCAIGAGVSPVLANDAAHKIAEKFAGELEASKGAATAERTADKAAQDAKTAADVKRQAESRRRAAEKKAADARRVTQAAEQQRSDEAEIQARARAEYDALIAEEKLARDAELAAADQLRLAVEEQRRAEAAAAEETRRTMEEAKIVEARRLAADLAAREKERQAELQREEEGRRLAEKLAKAREMRLGKQSEQTETVAAAPSTPAAPLATAPSEPETAPVAIAVADRDTAAPSEPSATRVTVLLMMDAGDRGIRRFNKSADPVLCIGETCYISNGATTSAKAFARTIALGSANTLGGRAGACNQKLSCVFRGVDLGGTSASVQPVDLKIMRHDRREPRDVRADASCVVGANRLDCAQPVLAADYRLWVVPEPVAEKAGAGALEAALIEGLMDVRRTELAPR